MKLSQAISKGRAKKWLNASVRRSPSNSKEWFIMLKSTTQRLSMLVDDEDNVIVSEDLNEFVDLMKQIGIGEFTVFL